MNNPINPTATCTTVFLSTPPSPLEIAQWLSCPTLHRPDLTNKEWVHYLENVPMTVVQRSDCEETIRKRLEDYVFYKRAAKNESLPTREELEEPLSHLPTPIKDELFQLIAGRLSEDKKQIGEVYKLMSPLLQKLEARRPTQAELAEAGTYRKPLTPDDQARIDELSKGWEPNREATESCFRELDGDGILYLYTHAGSHYLQLNDEDGAFVTEVKL